jgi:hypothetical protein
VCSLAKIEPVYYQALVCRGSRVAQAFLSKLSTPN